MSREGSIQAEFTLEVMHRCVTNGTLMDTNKESHNRQRKNCCSSRMLTDPRNPPMHSTTPQDKLLVLASNWNSYNKRLAHSLMK